MLKYIVFHGESFEHSGEAFPEATEYSWIRIRVEFSRESLEAHKDSMEWAARSKQRSLLLRAPRLRV